MGSLLQDLRYGLGMLAKNPGFTAVAVITLALGIGANTAIFSVVNAVLLHPLPYKDPDRLVKVWETYSQFPKVWASVPNFLDWRDESRAFEEIAAYRVEGSGFNLTVQGEPHHIQGTFASSNLFPALGTKAYLGRTFRPTEDKPGGAPVVILSFALWQRLFGSDPSLIGKAVTLNGKSYDVVGIMSRGFQFPTWAELWMPLGLIGPDELTSRIHHPVEVVARLKPDATLPRAQAEMNALAARLADQYPKTNKGWGAKLFPLKEELVGSLRTPLSALFAATGLVLLIGCANVANLLLARAKVREKEIAIRVALGAGRWHVVRQLLSESVLLSLGGCAVGILLAFWALDVLGALLAADIPPATELGINVPVVGFAAAISVLTGIIFGMIPALHTFRPDVNECLKQGTRTSVAGFRRPSTRNFLVVSEVALALLLLVGAGLLIKTFARLLGVDPGFDPHRVLALRLDLPESNYSSDERLDAFYGQLSRRVEALPGVESVGMINFLPFGRESANKTRFVVEGKPRSADEPFPVAEVRSTDPNYFRAMRIPLLKGRFFSEQEKTPVTIINETLARRFFPDEDPIGKRINTGPLSLQPSWSSVIGVVGNVHEFGLAEKPSFDIYFDSFGTEMYLVVRTTSDPSSLVSLVRHEVQSLDRDLPVSNVTTLEQILSDSLSSRRFSMCLFGIFAGLALTLVAVGIYGVISYSVAQRRREIGIRMALGAQRRDVLRLVAGQGMVLALAGVGLGLGGAFGLSRFLASMLYAVRPIDPMTYAAVSLLLASVAFLASYIPARRATKVDPMVALRYE